MYSVLCEVGDFGEGTVFMMELEGVHSDVQADTT
jgi:hypothetical protein